MTKERVRLRIGSMSKAVLVTGQVYQDPKDALNEFISNAADEYAEAGRTGGQIRVVLRRRGRHPVLAIEDFGRGMTAERLREIARNLFRSAKAGDRRTIGEKAIGILAFQQLGARCDIVTRPEGSTQTLALRLQRGKPIAELDLDDRRRPLHTAGTTVFISDLDPEALRVLTLRKLVDYLRRRRGLALARGDYRIEVAEGRQSVTVTPEEPDGIALEIPARPTALGRSSSRCTSRRGPIVIGGSSSTERAARRSSMICLRSTSSAPHHGQATSSQDVSRSMRYDRRPGDARSFATARPSRSSSMPSARSSPSFGSRSSGWHRRSTSQ